MCCQHSSSSAVLLPARNNSLLPQRGCCVKPWWPAQAVLASARRAAMLVRNSRRKRAAKAGWHMPAHPPSAGICPARSMLERFNPHTRCCCKLSRQHVMCSHSSPAAMQGRKDESGSKSRMQAIIDHHQPCNHGRPAQLPAAHTPGVQGAVPDQPASIPAAA